MTLLVEYKVRLQGSNCEPYPMLCKVEAHSVATGIRYAREHWKREGYEPIEPYHVTIASEED